MACQKRPGAISLKNSVVIRCCSCRGFVLGVLWEESTVFRYTCLRKKQHMLNEWGGELGVRGLSTGVGVMLLIEVSLCCGASERNGTSPLPSSLERRVSTCCCPGNLPRRVKTFPQCVPGVSQIHDFTLFASGLFDCLVVLCTYILFQAGWLSLKTPKFRNLVWWGPTLIL